MSAAVVIDLAVLAGVGVVLPLAFGHARWFGVAVIAVSTSMIVPTGPAAGVVAATWIAVALAVLVVQSDKIAAGFGVVAASAFTASRLGLNPFDIAEPIVELTAVHFTYAGVGALTLARALDRGRPRLRTAAVVLCVAAPPVVALGFVAHHPVPQIGGALLMTSAALLIATGELWEAAGRGRWTTRRVLLAVSGIAPWIPMGLAVVWATSNYWTVPALSIPDMVRTHGTMNLVFVIAGLFARQVLQDVDEVAPEAQWVA